MDESEGIGSEPDSVRHAQPGVRLAPRGPRWAISNPADRAKVLEGYPAFALLYYLDRLKVAAAIRRRPDARYVVVQNGPVVALADQI